MNNVGALALLIPIALQMASRLKMPPGRIFDAAGVRVHTGWHDDLIGTPPNLIVSGMRAEMTEAGYFSMSRLYAGRIGRGCGGVIHHSSRVASCSGARSQSVSGSFDLNAYLTEVRIPCWQQS